MQSDELVQLLPEAIIADNNSRFNLKPSRVEQLITAITDAGGVLVPIEVEPTEIKGKYRLVSGFYRHAAVTKLNLEGAGLTLPAIVREIPDALTRLKHQLSENIDRENQSPMDIAIAIKRLEDAGMPRIDIRRLFARPGGKKGTTVAPASNAWVNIMLQLLELPAGVQAKIHNGTVGVAAAYELGKVPADKRAAVLERAEEERVKQIEREERDEERFLDAEGKLLKAAAEEKEAVSGLDQARALAEEARLNVEARTAELREIQKRPYLEMEPAEKKEVMEALKAAESNLKGAQQASKKAQNELAKQLKAANNAADVAKKQAEKLAAARGAKKSAPNKKDVGVGDIRKAAKDEGVSTEDIPLKISEMVQFYKDVSKAKGFDKVQAIGRIVLETLKGQHTSKEAAYEFAYVTGEAKRPKK